MILIKNRSWVALALASQLFLLSGCLKSRLQVRGDNESDDSGKPVPTQVQDVKLNTASAIEELKSEMTRLTGRVEDLERSRNEAGPGLAKKDDVKKLETRIVELEQAQARMLEVITQMQSAKAAAAAAEHEAAAPETLDKAIDQFNQGEFDAAIEGLSAYLKNPKAKRAEEATFYRAEAYFATKQYKKAIVDYSRFPEKFTKSKRMPHALLQIGRSFEAMGMKEDAKGFYQELTEKFPKSPEAKKVRGKNR